MTLPDGFDPARHSKALVQLIARQHGEGFEIDSVDPETRIATATRQTALTQVAAAKGNADVREVRLVRGTKITDGDRMAVKLADQQGDGWEMTRFEPFLGKATLSKLSPSVARCRSALAVALSVKPWEVQVSALPDGGFEVELPNSYVPSKHDEKMLEVASSVVGRPGWYVRTNPRELKATIVPSEPPTFDPVIPYPFASPVVDFRQDKTAWAKIPLGMKLGSNGRPGEVLNIDLEASPHAQISGTSGSGKSVTLNAYIAGALARGAELAIVDLPSKSVDFLWCKGWVRDGGWGCDSLEAAVTTLGLIYDEGQRRARILAEHAVTKWTELSPELIEREKMNPIVVVVDEVSGLFVLEEVPKGLPKTHALVMEAVETNTLKEMLKKYIGRIAAEMRFVGIKITLSSQVSSTTTGVPTSIRMNLANELLLGTKPTDNNRKLSLSDAGSVPVVPANIQNDSKAGRGVGVSEFEGQEPAVFKTFYASTSQFGNWLANMGLSTTNQASPTPAQIAKYTV